jgi:hypothetical protein
VSTWFGLGPFRSFFIVFWLIKDILKFVSNENH